MNPETISSLLSSYDEWNVIGNKPRPYVFTIAKNNQELVYVGATHARDPHDAQFEILEREWNAFLEKAKGAKMVFIEAGLRAIASTKEDAIIQNAEAGFVSFLAHKANIDVMCPEPDAESERQELLKFFTPEQIQYYYFTRILPSWHETKKVKAVDFEDYIASHAKRLSWEEVEFSLERLKSTHVELFQKEFNEEDIDFIKKVINPTTEYSVINKVARASSTYRDICIVSHIVDQWNQGKSLFVVFGFAHAVLQEKALRALL